jgi:hypothetical protein
MSEETGLSTQLSAADTIALLQKQSGSKYATAKALTAVTKAGEYLPYIQVMGSNSNPVKEGKCQMGHFYLTKGKQLIDLGTSMVAMLISWRPKAMQYSPEVLSYFDTESEKFQAVAARAEQPQSGCGNGPEFLVWLPEHGELATFYFGNASGRVEGPNVVAAMGKGELKCRFNCEIARNEKRKQMWHVAKMYPYELEINVAPPTDLLMTHLDKFNNPKESVLEVAEKADTGSDRG